MSRIRNMKLSRRKLSKSTQQLLEQTYEQRRWLEKHGMSNRIIFKQPMIAKLRKYFIDLDQDGSNSVSSAQLEDPLILFGMCENREQVEDLFQILDVDGSGQMDFKEFMHVFRKVASQKKQNRLCRVSKPTKSFDQFTNLLKGIKGRVDNNVSMRLGMSIYRRKHLINAIMSKSQKVKTQGQEIMNKFQKQVSTNPQTMPKLIDHKKIRQDFTPSLPQRKVILDPIHKRIRTVF